MNLSTLWVEHHFEKSFLVIVKGMANNWVPCTVGEARPVMNEEDKPPQHLIRADVRLQYTQGLRYTCLYSGAASALAHLSCANLAEAIEKEGRLQENMPMDMQIKALRKILDTNSAVSKVKVYDNRYKKGGKGKRHKRSIDLWNQEPEDKKMPLILILKGSDGYLGHAITLVDDLIFDSNLLEALTFNKESIDWCCNCKGGFANSYHAICVILKKKA